MVDRILEHWQSLTLFFQREVLEERLPAAVSILESLRNPVTKLYMLFLSHVLNIITKCNLELQSENPKVPLLLDRILTMHTLFLKAFIKPEILNKYAAKDISVTNPHNFLEIDSVYCGTMVNVFVVEPNTHISNAELQSFKVNCLGFYTEFCKQVKSRFNFNNKYLLFAKQFTPKIAVTGNILSIAPTILELFPNIKWICRKLRLNGKVYRLEKNLKILRI